MLWFEMCSPVVTTFSDREEFLNDVIDTQKTKGGIGRVWQTFWKTHKNKESVAYYLLRFMFKIMETNPYMVTKIHPCCSLHEIIS